MDIVDGKNNTDTCPLKFKIGGAALVFERARHWKHSFRNLLLETCQVVQENCAHKKYSLGNILYASLVHSIVEMIGVFAQHGRAPPNTQVDLGRLMSSTGIWKQDAQLDKVVEVAARFLLLYKGVDSADANLKGKLLVEFEVVWREVIDPFISTHPLLSRHFSDGGHLFPELLGSESYASLRTIRTNILRMRKEEEEAGSSCGTSVSVAQ